MRKPPFLLIAKIVTVLVVTVLLHPVESWAGQFQSQYFNISIEDEVDIHRLIMTVNADDFLYLDFLSSKSGNAPEQKLRNVLDALYLEVANILDIHMQNARINLVVFPRRSQVRDILYKQFVRKAPSEAAFYIFHSNTIYFSVEGLDVGILGHEIAHAIISDYFVVPPPEKVQEILAGYVCHRIKKNIPN